MISWFVDTGFAPHLPINRSCSTSCCSPDRRSPVLIISCLALWCYPSFACINPEVAVSALPRLVPHSSSPCSFRLISGVISSLTWNSSLLDFMPRFPFYFTSKLTPRLIWNCLATTTLINSFDVRNLTIFHRDSDACARKLYACLWPKSASHTSMPNILQLVFLLEVFQTLVESRKNS